MSSDRLPRICLFGWLPQVRPFHGPKRRWRDIVKSDLQSLGISDGCWCDKARNRKQWQALCLQCVDDQQTDQARTVLCIICKCCFRRQSDRARHKCIVDKQQPIREQPGAVQCQNCECWFRSKGGWLYTGAG